MKRILFVDDETNVLEGLRRMLRPQRDEWDMIFALGGAEALNILETTGIDVVVTDMRMPGLDGAALLEKVHDRFPGILRIVLSGYFDTEAGLRAVPVAHQFLSKPCQPEQLKAAIERSTQLMNAPADEATRRVVSAIGALPSPPKTCTMLLEAIQKPGVSMDAIVQIVDRDVAIAAKVLQLVNSGFFGFPRVVSSVNTAINLLGVDLLKQLVLSAGVLKTFQPTGEVKGFSLHQFECHSQLTATIAGYLSAHLGALSTAGAIAALLHDTGKLVLATYLHEEFAQAIAQSVQERRPLYECEGEIFGTSHAEIGGYLLNMWGLPLATVDAISFHHRPTAPGCSRAEFGLRGVIHLADALAHEPLDKKFDPQAFPLGSDTAYLTGLGIEGRLPEWRSQIRRRVAV